MTHELDTYAKFRRAAARATDIRAEQDAATTLRETAARLQPAAPSAAAISPALAAALATADRSMAAAAPRPTTAAVTKTPPAAVPTEIKTCPTGRALGLTNDQRAAAAAAVEQWRPGELQRATGLTRVETEFGRWAVLRRDAVGNVSAFDFIRA